MKRSKSFAIGMATFFILVICAVVIFLLHQYAITKAVNAKGDSYDQAIAVVNENYPSDIIAYGEDIGFRASLRFRTITEITEASLTSDQKYKYALFVINDRNGQLNISDQEFELIKRLTEEKNLNFYYIGTQYLQKLKEFGFYSTEYMNDYHGMGYVISRSPSGHSSIHGLWTSVEEENYKINHELLGDIVVDTFVDDVIKMLN
ncbi:MAG: hypothetical protein QM689_11160 [Oscillospiraceae bacterium]